MFHPPSPTSREMECTGSVSDLRLKTSKYVLKSLREFLNVSQCLPRGRSQGEYSMSLRDILSHWLTRHVHPLLVSRREGDNKSGKPSGPGPGKWKVLTKKIVTTPRDLGPEVVSRFVYVSSQTQVTAFTPGLTGKKGPSGTKVFWLHRIES